MNQTNYQYPVAWLPEDLQRVFIEIKNEYQAPDAIIVGAMLAAISHACQQRVTLKRGKIETPVCLNLIFIAQSGERKTAVEKLVMAANVGFDQASRKNCSLDITAFKADLDVWTAARKGLMAQLKSAVKNNEEVKELELRLRLHIESKPIEPVMSKTVYNDTTIEALLDGLNTSNPSAMLMSSEGATILFGPAIRGVDKLNILWDGGDLHVDRKKGSFTVSNAKLTTSLMIQPEPFAKFLEARGEMVRGLGYFARSLISFPPSTQGGRYINNFDEREMLHVPKFHQRISELLAIDEENPDGTVLSFTVGAMHRWIAFYNAVENDLRVGGYLADVRDFGSKIADNVARIAALLHTYSGAQGDISFEFVDRACNIGCYYIEEFKALFGTTAISQEQIDVHILESWLCEQFVKHNMIFNMPKQRIRNYGPNSLRNSGRLGAALYEMAMMRRIGLAKQGRTDFVIPNVDYFQNLLWPHQATPWASQNSVATLPIECINSPAI